MLADKESVNTYDEIVITPNPFDDIISIILQDAPVSISVFDMSGTLKYSARLTGLRNELNLSELRSGIYFINIIKDGKFVKTVKIIKK